MKKQQRNKIEKILKRKLDNKEITALNQFEEIMNTKDICKTTYLMMKKLYIIHIEERLTVLK